MIYAIGMLRYWICGLHFKWGRGIGTLPALGGAAGLNHEENARNDLQYFTLPCMAREPVGTLDQVISAIYLQSGINHLNRKIATDASRRQGPILADHRLLFG